MATEESISMEAMDIQGGKITFAPDVIATIASLAANEVEGVDSLGGTVVEGITGMLRAASWRASGSCWGKASELASGRRKRGGRPQCGADLTYWEKERGR